MKAVSVSTVDGVSVARFTRVASSFGARLVGLLNRGKLSDKEGLLLSPGGSIHTIGMRFPIDAVFLDKRMCVLKLAPSVQPWRGVLAPRRTRHVLELAEGRIEAVGLRPGAQLRAE
jgi:uncharacterized protein